jgi:glycosyltransferase A (GT-A) superfamily protein (DUF2064 family)
MTQTLLYVPDEPRTADAARAADLLQRFDAVLGMDGDDGWWLFGLRDPAYASRLDLTAGAGALALATIRLGLRLALVR